MFFEVLKYHKEKQPQMAALLILTEFGLSF